MRKLRVLLLGGRKFHWQIKMGIRCGLNVMSEPILANVVHALNLSNHQQLKKKARILIPESACLIGVVDESGILEANEVFVQIRRDSFYDGKDEKEINIGVDD